jgi:hypothetical protein
VSTASSLLVCRLRRRRMMFLQLLPQPPRLLRLSLRAQWRRLTKRFHVTIFSSFKSFSLFSFLACNFFLSFLFNPVGGEIVGFGVMNLRYRFLFFLPMLQHLLLNVCLNVLKLGKLKLSLVNARRGLRSRFPSKVYESCEILATVNCSKQVFD